MLPIVSDWRMQLNLAVAYAAKSESSFACEFQLKIRSADVHSCFMWFEL